MANNCLNLLCQKSPVLGDWRAETENKANFMKTYELNGEEYIELIKLLKIMRISESGGQAKLMVEDGLVYLNGIQEWRKRAKLRGGDLVEVTGYKIRII